jgi:hypothetical protein
VTDDGARRRSPEKPVDGHPVARRRRFNERLRAEYIAGAEEEWLKRTARPMTAQELERVLRRYPAAATSSSGHPS